AVEVEGHFERPPTQGAVLPPRSAEGSGTAAGLRVRSHLRCVLSPVSVGLGLPPPVWARPAAYAPRTARPVPAVVCPPLMRGNGLLHRMSSHVGSDRPRRAPSRRGLFHAPPYMAAHNGVCETSSRLVNMGVLDQVAAMHYGDGRGRQDDRTRARRARQTRRPPAR